MWEEPGVGGAWRGISGQAEIPALERERQEDWGFKACLSYTMFKSEANLSYLNPCLKKLKQKDPYGVLYWLHSR